MVVQDVLAKEEMVRFDRPITRYLVDHRDHWLTTTLRIVTQLGSTVFLVPVAATIGVLAYRRLRTWRPMIILGSVLLGSVVLYDIVKALVGRPRPDVGPLVATATGSSFPSGHVTQSAAVYGALALMITPLVSSWEQRVATWSTAILVVALIALSRVYLGVHWTTDVVGGFALGSAWLFMVVTATDAVHRPPLQAPIVEGGARTVGKDRPRPGSAGPTVAVAKGIAIVWGIAQLLVVNVCDAPVVKRFGQLPEPRCLARAGFSAGYGRSAR